MAQKPVIMERDFDSVKPEHIEEVQKRLGVKFPSLLIECVKNNNEGCPHRDSFFLIRPDGSKEEAGISAFLSFDLDDIFRNIVETYEDPPEYFPQGIMAFANGVGGDLICFDYRDGKDNLNPPVVYWSHEYEENEGISYLADNFDDFMDMMFECEY